MAIEIIVEPFESPRVVQIPASSGRSVTIQDLFDAMRAWEDSMTGMHYPQLVDGAGKEQLGTGKFVGITITLQNTQIQFEPSNQIHAMSTSTANTDGVLLTDTTASFLSDDIHLGDSIVNSSSGAIGVVMEVIDDENLRVQNMNGGMRQNWLIGDSYHVIHVEKCIVTGGNIVAVDEAGDPIDPLLPSTNCYVTLESSTSAALLDESLGQGSINNIVNQIWDADEAKRLLGLSHENVTIDQPVYDTDGNLTSARVRLYSDAASVGSDLNIIASYNIAAPSTGPGIFTTWSQKKV